MSIWSGTPSRLMPSSSAVSPQRSSDSVNTILARLKLPSSRAICSTVSTITGFISPASAAGTVENAAVKLTSAIFHLSISSIHGTREAPRLRRGAQRGGYGGPWPGPPCLMPCGGGGAQVIEAGFQSLVGDADAHRLGELERGERLFLGDDREAAAAQRREDLVGDLPG